MSAEGTQYLIWSHEHGAWWQPGGWGYTQELDRAGLFDEEDARSICERACYQWMRGWVPPYGNLPAEVMIPVTRDSVVARERIAEATRLTVRLRDAVVAS